MTRVLLVGGRGHIGAPTAAVLGSLEGIEFHRAGRRRSPDCEVALDLAEPGTYAAADAYDIVVNATDTYSLPPDRLIQRCLENGQVFVETTADLGTYRRLYERFDGDDDSTDGLLVAGAGVFPGLSNLLAGGLFRARGRRRIELFLSWSAISGAGSGTCEVMVRALSTPTRRYRDGQLEVGPPIARPRVEEAYGEGRVAMEIGLPEPLMLQRSCGAAETATTVSLTPQSPLWMLRLFAALARRGVFAGAAAQAILRGAFRAFRAGLLRNRGTPLTMVAVADRLDDEPLSGARRAVRFPDAFQAAAYAIAGTVVLLAGLPDRPTGLRHLDQLFSFETLLEEMEGMGSEGIETLE